MSETGTKKERVELIPVLLEVAEMGGDYPNLGKRQDRIEEGTDESKAGHREANVQEATGPRRVAVHWLRTVG